MVLKQQSNEKSRPADGLRHLARPAIPAAQHPALGRDRVTAGPHRPAAGGDQGRREQRAAVPVGRLADAAAAAATIAKMAPILASQVQEHIYVNGYTDNTPIGPELAAAGGDREPHLSQKRAETVMNFLISQGVKPDAVGARLRRRRPGRTERYRRRPGPEPPGRDDADRTSFVSSQDLEIYRYGDALVPNCRRERLHAG